MFTSYCPVSNSNCPESLSNANIRKKTPKKSKLYCMSVYMSIELLEVGVIF